MIYFLKDLFIKGKKPSFWLVIVAVGACITVGIAFVANPKTNTGLEDAWAQDIYQYRTQYVGDSSKVSMISQKLKTPETLTRTGIQLYTDKTPYLTEVKYRATPEIREYFSSNLNQTFFDESAIIMFALIGNVENIKFIINDGQVDMVIQRTRDWAEKVMGQNIWNDSTTLEQFTSIYNNIMNKLVLNNSSMSLDYKIRKTDAYDSIINDLSAIPLKYSVDDFEKDGYYVMLHGQSKSDIKIMEKFITDSQNGKKTSVTTVDYTVEGDPIVTRVLFDGATFYGVRDSSRDAFKGGYEDYSRFEYKYIKTFEDNTGKFALLLNDDSVTVEKYRKSMLSSNSKDWIEHYFLYYVKQ